MPDEPDFLKAAFKHEFNLIGVCTAIGFAVISGTALPALLAAGVEMIVLPLLSGSERFQRYVRARKAADEQELRQAKKHTESSEMLRALADGERQRYRALEGLAAEIRENYRGLDASSRMLLDDLVRKLDFLLGFYLRMRWSVARYDEYFATTDPEHIQERIAMLEQEAATGPQRIRQIKARTKGVLLKRLERYKKAEENRQLIDAQTETVMEVLQLLRDQSYQIRDPRSITEQLDGLVSSAEETERGVRDMEDILSAEEDVMAGLPTGDIEAELSAGRPVDEAPVAAPPPRLRDAPPPTSSPPPPPRKKITH